MKKLFTVLLVSISINGFGQVRKDSLAAPSSAHLQIPTLLSPLTITLTMQQWQMITATLPESQFPAKMVNETMYLITEAFNKAYPQPKK